MLHEDSWIDPQPENKPYLSKCANASTAKEAANIIGRADELPEKRIKQSKEKPKHNGNSK
jgi:hypothetical protein